MRMHWTKVSAYRIGDEQLKRNQEVAYTPCSLYAQCANHFAVRLHYEYPNITLRDHLSRTLPTHIYQAIAESPRYPVISTESPRESNPSSPPLRVGHFVDFPHALTRVEPALYRGDVVAQARRVLTRLADVNSEPLLDNPDVVRYSIDVRYPLFLQLCFTYPDRVLIPPMDVQAIWYTHLLQTCEYHQFIQNTLFDMRTYEQKLQLAHPWTLSLAEDAQKQAEDFTQTVWATATTEPYTFLGTTKPLPTSTDVLPLDSHYGIGSVQWKQDAKATQKKKPSESTLTWRKKGSPKAQDIVDARGWYRALCQETEGTQDMTAEAFLERALLGYQKFMYLQAKYPKRMKSSSYARPPRMTIELMWHTLLAQPGAYEWTCKRVIGYVVGHAGMENRESPGTDQSRQLWMDEFGEDSIVYVV